jgi:hypothetical protein
MWRMDLIETILEGRKIDVEVIKVSSNKTLE